MRGVFCNQRDQECTHILLFIAELLLLPRHALALPHIDGDGTELLVVGRILLSEPVPNQVGLTRNRFWGGSLDMMNRSVHRGHYGSPIRLFCIERAVLLLKMKRLDML